MKFKIALCQMMVADNKEANIEKADAMIREAARGGAQMICLPEIWNCPYSGEYFRAFGEPEGGKTYTFMSKLAKELGIYLIGGSIPELEDSALYNTSFCFDREGNLIGKHRKIHLFDIDIRGGIQFMESKDFTPGENITIIDTEYGKIGIAICFDVRFPELFRRMALDGAKLVVLPAAFNMTTGPAHWEISMRMRALDNQIYFAAISPARDPEGPYVAWGHSCVISPWGNIVATADEGEAILYTQIDEAHIEDVRQQLPLLKSRRPDLY